MGGRITGGQGNIHLVRTGGAISPDVSTMAQAQAVPDGFDEDWSLTAYAVCVPRPGEGDSTVETEFVSGSGAAQRVTATCPAGMSVTGGAGTVDGPNPIPVIQAVLPEALPGAVPADEVEVVAREDIPTSANWTVIAVAFCHR